ncbi:hypothetical protein D3C87_1815370 [compost metagenome]
MNFHSDAVGLVRGYTITLHRIFEGVDTVGNGVDFGFHATFCVIEQVANDLLDITDAVFLKHIAHLAFAQIYSCNQGA